MPALHDSTLFHFHHHSNLRLDCILPLREMPLLLLLLLRLYRLFMLRQPSSNSASLLGSKVEREVLLLLVKETQLRSLVGVDDCENFRDGLSEVVDFGEFRGSSAGNLLHAQLSQLGLQLIELFLEVVFALAPELAGLHLRGNFTDICDTFI